MEGEVPADAVAFLTTAVRLRRGIRVRVDDKEEVVLHPLGLVLKVGEWFLAAQIDGDCTAIAVDRLHGYGTTATDSGIPKISASTNSGRMLLVTSLLTTIELIERRATMRAGRRVGLFARAFHSSGQGSGQLAVIRSLSRWRAFARLPMPLPIWVSV